MSMAANLRIKIQVEFDDPIVKELDSETAMMLAQALRALASSVATGNLDTAGQCETFRVKAQMVGTSINQQGRAPQTIIATEQIDMKAELERVEPPK